MNISYTVREWLQRAFTEQADRINESYFYDRPAGEFYSVFITDYFLTDPNSAEDFPNSPYSKDELAVLSARIERQEGNDPSIVVVPRLTIEERKEMMQAFLNEQRLHDDELQSLADAENGRTNLDFNSLLSQEEREKWQAFKWDYIQDKIDSFCNLQNINLEDVRLWKDDKMTTVTLDLNEKPKDLHDTVNQEIAVTKKPWWKFW
jgi:uncharacterized membrane protein